ncbi:hypothetical protein M5D96_013852 [Drosophila gunungcola]|uniref:Uncharacterized protein n=1 Tax=Drosophila gunungcola TaxID=103775 RepID=A0A9P9YBA2_9MUSC|nr:hypothetical protein M5D96_013852 [Drosophila gunungcola]
MRNIIRGKYESCKAHTRICRKVAHKVGPFSFLVTVTPKHYL